MFSSSETEAYQAEPSRAEIFSARLVSAWRLKQALEYYENFDKGQEGLERSGVDKDETTERWKIDFRENNYLSIEPIPTSILC